MSASFSPVFILQQGDPTESLLRPIAKQKVEFYQSRRERRQHVIATLRGKIANARRIAEDSTMDAPTLELLLTCLLKQHVLIDELERNN